MKLFRLLFAIERFVNRPICVIEFQPHMDCSTMWRKPDRLTCWKLIQVILPTLCSEVRMYYLKTF